MERPLRTGTAVLFGVALLVLVAVRWGSDPTEPTTVFTEAAPAPVVDPLPREGSRLSAASLQGLRFEDVTREVGLSRPGGAVPSGDAISGQSSGLALTPWGSGARALLVTPPFEDVRFYVLRNGRFTDRTRAVGLDGVGRGSAAGFADLDGDGDPDLVLGRQDGSVVTVLRNDDGRFSDVTRAVGVNPGSTSRQPNTRPAIRGVAFADVDRDGHLDFVIADWNPAVAWTSEIGIDPDPDRAACLNQARARDLEPLGGSQTRLYLGDGDGTFTDATRAWRLDADKVMAFTPQFVDLDEDGRLDLLMTGDVCSSRVLRNTGSGFVDVTERTPDPMTPFGMGAVVRDLDGDERPDWLVTGISYPTATGECPSVIVTAGCSGNRFLRGTGGLGFADATDVSGLRDSGWAWGVAAEDFANTGDTQVAVTNGYAGGTGDTSTQQGRYFSWFRDDPLAFFVRDGAGRFVDAAAQVGLDDTGVGHGLLALDADEDGRLDLLVHDADTGPHLYRNVTPREDRHWVAVRLDDSTVPGNRAAWGARVRIESASGSVTNCWTTSSTSYETSWPGTCHAGLGDADGPVTVRVWWPGRTTPQIFDAVAPDRVVTLRR